MGIARSTLRGMDARVPSLCHVWGVLLGLVLAAKAAGTGLVLVRILGFASRDIAPC